MFVNALSTGRVAIPCVLVVALLGVKPMGRNVGTIIKSIIQDRERLLETFRAGTYVGDAFDPDELFAFRKPVQFRRTASSTRADCTCGDRPKPPPGVNTALPPLPSTEGRAT